LGVGRTKEYESPGEKVESSKLEFQSQEKELRQKARAAIAAAYEFKPDASRPYFQFLFQVSRERKWIRDGHPSDDVEKINELAYECVKEMWVRDKIWDTNWGKYPGMKWMHEFPCDGHDQSLSAEQDQSTGPKIAAAPTQKASPNRSGKTTVKKDTVPWMLKAVLTTGIRRSSRIAEAPDLQKKKRWEEIKSKWIEHCLWATERGKTPKMLTLRENGSVHWWYQSLGEEDKATFKQLLEFSDPAGSPNSSKTVGQKHREARSAWATRRRSKAPRKQRGSKK
jgi:hypothetical protein